MLYYLHLNLNAQMTRVILGTLQEHFVTDTSVDMIFNNYAK